MGFSKCRIGWIWSIGLTVILVGIPRYWELTKDSMLLPHQPVHAAPKIEVVEGTIQKNMTLVATLVDSDIPVAIANEVSELIKPVFDMRRIRWGNLFRLEKTSDGTLHAFEYKIDDERVLKIRRE